MTSKTAKVFLLSIIVAIITVSIAGCQEANLGDSKKARLVASEKKKKKKQLEKCQADLETQKELIQDQAKDFEAQTAKYQEQINQLQGQTAEFLQQQIENFVGALVEETARLQQENTVLRERLEELEG